MGGGGYSKGWGVVVTVGDEGVVVTVGDGGGEQ